MSGWNEGQKAGISVLNKNRAELIFVAVVYNVLPLFIT